MKSKFLKDIIVLAAILAVILIICQFIPEQIPFHINAQGEVDMRANKYFLLFGSIIPYSVYWRFLRNRRKKNK